MKWVVLIMAMAFALSACGGGGGGAAAPSVNLDSPPPEETRRLTPAEQAELRTAADALLNDLDGLENNAEANSLRQEIDALIADINAARHTIEELQNEIAELRMEVKTLKEKPPSPPDETMTPPPDETTTPPDETTTPPPDETMTPPVYDTAEFQANYASGRMGALTAYEKGYHGQNVTIAVAESIKADHEDLDANVLTLSVDYAWRWDRFETFPTLVLTGLTVTIEGGKVFHNPTLTTSYHGTRGAGLIAAERNGKGAHGVAPQAKLIPLPGANFTGQPFDASEVEWLATSTVSVHIFSRSVVTRFIPMAARDIWSILADKDIVISQALGNNAAITLQAYQFQYAGLPNAIPELEDNWLVVGYLNADNVINSGSTRCGDVMMWCVMSYGSNSVDGRLSLITPFGPANNSYRSFSGTSASAPLVAGALALLKSAAPEIPMTVIRQILLTTTTDLGDEGIDEVYGWGLVNISAGIDHIENLEMANGMAYSDLRKSLPSEFSHLRGRMESVSVAIRITDRSFYNMRLSDIVGGGDSDSHSASLGNAAKEMQADDSLSPENAGFGFNYANGDYDLHYAGGNENAFRFSGGLRHDDSQSSYIGEGSSPFAAENASDTGGYVKWTTKNYGGISAFGEYGRTQIKADYDSASFISQIKNARAEEWTAGFQYRNLFLHNDNLQFSARQESRISGGEMVLHYPVADGDSHKAFIGESVQTIRTETAKIPIKQKPQTIYTAGYSQKTENSKWSAAAEWNTATNAKGFSFAVELQIR